MKLQTSKSKLQGSFKLQPSAGLFVWRSGLKLERWSFPGVWILKFGVFYEP